MSSGMKAGAYKVCITDMQPGSAVLWKESGVVLILQKQISSISVNGIIEVVATVPQRIGEYPPLVLRLNFNTRAVPCAVHFQIARRVATVLAFCLKEMIGH